MLNDFQEYILIDHVGIYSDDYVHVGYNYLNLDENGVQDLYFSYKTFKLCELYQKSAMTWTVLFSNNSTSRK